MASIKKRGDTYRVQVRRKGFAPESATFSTKAQAELWARQREGELVGMRYGLRPKRTVRQAMERYRDEVSPGHRGSRWEQVRIGKLIGTPTERDPHTPREPQLPFADKLLSVVTPDDVATWRDRALKQLAPGSVRREYGLVRAVFAMSLREWDWLEASPFDRVKAPAEGASRRRRVSDPEANTIVAKLGYNRGTRPATSSQYTAVAFLLALETMMRQGEILSLTRDQVHADASFLHLDRTKNGDERDVPLSPAALDLLSLLPTIGSLFPIKAAVCDTLFRRARDASGLQDLHFHDSRREATTRLSKKLQPLELAKAGGWRDLNMILRVYYAPSASEAAEKLRTA